MVRDRRGAVRHPSAGAPAEREEIERNHWPAPVHAMPLSRQDRRYTRVMIERSLGDMR
jgi:hypothetical protein